MWRNLVRKFLRRRRCLCDRTTVFYETARIINGLKDPGAIRIGPHTHIRGELLTFAHGGEIKIGAYGYVGEDSRIWSARSILIGDRVLISHNVNIFDNLTHPINPRARHEQFKQIITTGQPKEIDLGEKPVVIHDDVLIGCLAVILAGVSLGEAAIVAAGSVVTKNVPPYTIVAGNPARIIREIPLAER